METRKFYEYDELKWFLSEFGNRIEIIKETQLKKCYKLKFRWVN